MTYRTQGCVNMAALCRWMAKLTRRVQLLQNVANVVLITVVERRAVIATRFLVPAIAHRERVGARTVVPAHDPIVLSAWAWTLKPFRRRTVYFVWIITNEMYRVVPE
jgi:hypothetical protein